MFLVLKAGRRRARVLAAATATIVSALALTGAPPAVASENAVEVHWETLQNGAYTDAGDYSSDFSPALNGNGSWELLPNTNGTPVLAYLQLENTASGTVEVHADALNGSTFTRVWNFTSGYTPAEAANGVMQLFGAVNGAPELGLIDLRNTGTGSVEVHWETLQNGVYTDAGDYGSDFPESVAADATWQLLPTTSGTPVLGAIYLKNTSSGTVEVHGDALNGNAYTRVWDFASHFTPAQAASGIMQLFGASNGAPELGFIDLASTGSGPVGVHWETVQNGVYSDAGDYASGYPQSSATGGTWQLFTPGADAPPELGVVKTSAPEAAPSPPVEPVITPQPLPVPAPSPGRGRVRARFVLTWTWNHTRTRLHKARVVGVPRDGRVNVRCRGKGCPATAGAAGYSGLQRLLRSLEGKVFRAGDVLTITVSAPHEESERIAVKIRDGALPRARLL